MDCFRVRPGYRAGKKKYISEDGYLETFVVNETPEDVWFDDFMVMSTTSPIMQETHYDPWGLELTGIGFQYGGIKANKYLYQGKEMMDDHNLNIYDFHARGYDPVIGRTWQLDPHAENFYEWSNYSWAGDNPTIMIDPTGMDWYRDKDGAVVFDKNITSQEDLDNAEVSGSYLHADKFDKSVLDAIGSHIMNSGDKAFDVFLGYQDNKDLGENYFIDAAKQNYNSNASGIMKTLTDNFQSVADGLAVSQMTHDWVDNAGWTTDRNQTEHNIGMFVLSDKYNPSTAQNIGWGNEIRGLIINDEQSGNMRNALMGRPTNNGGPTAFEWRDLKSNSIGIRLWYKHRGVKDPAGMNAIPISP